MASPNSDGRRLGQAGRTADPRREPATTETAGAIGSQPLKPGGKLKPPLEFQQGTAKQTVTAL